MSSICTSPTLLSTFDNAGDLDDSDFKFLDEICDIFPEIDDVIAEPEQSIPVVFGIPWNNTVQSVPVVPGIPVIPAQDTIVQGLISVDGIPVDSDICPTSSISVAKMPQKRVRVDMCTPNKRGRNGTSFSRATFSAIDKQRRKQTIPTSTKPAETKVKMVKSRRWVLIPIEDKKQCCSTCYRAPDRPKRFFTAFPKDAEIKSMTYVCSLKSNKGRMLVPHNTNLKYAACGFTDPFTGKVVPPDNKTAVWNFPTHYNGTKLTDDQALSCRVIESARRYGCIPNTICRLGAHGIDGKLKYLLLGVENISPSSLDGKLQTFKLGGKQLDVVVL